MKKKRKRGRRRRERMEKRRRRGKGEEKGEGGKGAGGGEGEGSRKRRGLANVPVQIRSSKRGYILSRRTNKGSGDAFVCRANALSSDRASRQMPVLASGVGGGPTTHDTEAPGRGGQPLVLLTFPLTPPHPQQPSDQVGTCLNGASQQHTEGHGMPDPTPSSQATRDHSRPRHVLP